MNHVNEIYQEQRNEFNLSHNQNHLNFIDQQPFDIEPHEPIHITILENQEQSEKSIPNTQIILSKIIHIHQKLKTMKTNIHACVQATGRFIYDNKFISLVSIELILMLLKLLKVIPQNTETVLSLCFVTLFIIMGLIHFAILIARENERIRRFSIAHHELYPETNHTPSIRLSPNSQNHHHDESPNLRVQQIRTQIQNLGQLFNQMNNQIRAQRMLMAVQILAQNHGDQPILFPDQSQANFGEIIFSQNFFNLVAEASLQSNNQQNQGMNQEQIDSFPISLYNQNNEEIPEICSICLEEFIDGSEIRNLLCKHVFHQSCIDEWLRQRNNCPNCKMTFE